LISFFLLSYSPPSSLQFSAILCKEDDHNNEIAIPLHIREESLQRLVFVNIHNESCQRIPKIMEITKGGAEPQDVSPNDHVKHGGVFVSSQFQRVL